MARNEGWNTYADGYDSAARDDEREFKRLDQRIAKLDAALQQALRQWKMYAEMEDRDLRTEASPEGEMYRDAFVLTSKLTMKG